MTADIRAAYRSLSPPQKEYARALTFWIGEFGATSPFSRMQREEEEQKVKERKAAEQSETPQYRLSMGHAFTIVGASINERWTAYQKNLARHNFHIFDARGKLYEQEAEEVHGYFKKMFEPMADGDFRLRDLNSALKAVVDSGLCFASTPIWPNVTDADRHDPPLRPEKDRYITTASGRIFDTATYTG